MQNSKKLYFIGGVIVLIAVYVCIELRGDSSSQNPQRSEEYQNFIDQYPSNATPQQEEVFRKAREREQMPE